MPDNITDWLQQHAGVLTGLGIISAVLFVFSLLLLPWLLTRIPVDYFQRSDEQQERGLFSPITVLRNLLGGVILLAGVLMLVLPGQGLLTILLGLAVMDFPGKYRLERWVVMRKGVLETTNWIRQRAGYPPIKKAGT